MWFPVGPIVPIFNISSYKLLLLQLPSKCIHLMNIHFHALHTDTSLLWDKVVIQVNNVPMIQVNNVPTLMKFNV